MIIDVNGKSKKTYRLIVIIALILSILCMSVGYSAFREELVIKSNMYLNNFKWSISFANLKSVELYGNARELVAPTLNNSQIELSIELNSVNDKAVYTFDVENNGNISAVLSHDPIIVIEPVEYESSINIRLLDSNNNLISKRDALDTKTKKTITMEIEYNPSEMVLENITSDIKMYVIFIYVQK